MFETSQEHEEEEEKSFTKLTDSKKEELSRLESAGSTPRRVKVYLLKGDDWLDNGTGFCTGQIDKQSKTAYFQVISESNADEVLLKSNLEGSIQYQRQQETLIVWTDQSGCDLALSFQETEGCADLCDFIIKVQQNNLSPDISLYYVIPNVLEGEDITELITGPVKYPPEVPTMDNLKLISNRINQGVNAQFTRSNISTYLLDTNYIEKLDKIFQQSELEKNLTNLLLLSDIFKTLFLYNEIPLLDRIFDDDEKVCLLAGILEYDSDYPDHKANYREFLQNKSFKSIIPIEDITIFKKDFFLTFIKDVVTARFVDESTFGYLNSLISANQEEIFKYITQEEILQKIFKFYDDESENQVESKRDGVRMLHQYALIAKASQKQDFFPLLVKYGLLKMIRFSLKDDLDSIRVLGTELIVVIIEHDVSLVNSLDHEDTIDNLDPPLKMENFQKEKETTSDTLVSKDMRLSLSDDMTLILILSDLLVEDKNKSIKIQAFEALKTLLDPNIAIQSIAGKVNTSSAGTEVETGDEFKEINTNNYFNAFYTQAAPKLFAKIISIAKEETQLEVSSKDNSLFQLLCELISFCTKEHDVNISRPFFIENHVLLGISKLLIHKDVKTVLKLHVIRCLKNIVLLNDTIYTKYFINEMVLRCFFEYFESIIDENNLSNSTCLDLMEIITRNCDENINLKRANYKLLAIFIWDNFKDVIKNKLTFVSLGKEFVSMVENDFYESKSSGSVIANNLNNLIATDDMNASDDELINGVSTPLNEDLVKAPSVELVNDENERIDNGGDKHKLEIMSDRNGTGSKRPKNDEYSNCSNKLDDSKCYVVNTTS